MDGTPAVSGLLDRAHHLTRIGGGCEISFV